MMLKKKIKWIIVCQYSFINCDKYTIPLCDAINREIGYGVYKISIFAIIL